MEGPKFERQETTTDEESFKPYRGELSSELENKLNVSENLYKKISDPIVREAASLLAHAAINAANEETFQQTA